MSDRPSRLAGALRGLLLGALAGAVWFAVEAIWNWRGGGYVPAATLGAIAQLDLGLGAAAGLILGALLPRGGATLGVAMAMAYGFLRVFEPPGMGAELVYVLVGLDKEYTDRKPGERWEAYYAARIVRHFSPEAGPAR